MHSLNKLLSSCRVSMKGAKGRSEKRMQPCCGIFILLRQTGIWLVPSFFLPHANHALMFGRRVRVHGCIVLVGCCSMNSLTCFLIIYLHSPLSTLHSTFSLSSSPSTFLPKQQLFDNCSSSNPSIATPVRPKHR